MINPFTEDDKVWSWDPKPEPTYCPAGHQQPEVPYVDVPKEIGCLHCFRELEAAKGVTVAFFDGQIHDAEPEVGG